MLPDAVMAFAVAFRVVSEIEAGAAARLIVAAPSVSEAVLSTIAWLPGCRFKAPEVDNLPAIVFAPLVVRLMPPLAVRVFAPVSIFPLADTKFAEPLPRLMEPVRVIAPSVLRLNEGVPEAEASWRFCEPTAV